MPASRFSRLPLSLLCASALHSWAADAPAAPASDAQATSAETTTQQTEQISVTGRQLSDNKLRQQSTASRIIVGKEEIARFGDSSVADVLKRLPGVTVGGPPGRRGGQISMRGMASYTQILINGEPMARGFSLDSLSPELIERIEIMRSPLAEHSAQAVAGTINIVLREDARKRTTDVSLSASQTDGHKLQPRLGLQHSDKAGQLSYTFSGNLQRYDQQESASRSVQRQYDSTGALTSEQWRASERQSRGYSLHLAPRLGWRYGEGDTLNLQMFAMHSQDVDTGETTLTQPLGVAPYDTAQARSDNRFDMVRLNLNRQMPLGELGKLTLRLGGDYNRNSSEETRIESQLGQPDARNLDHTLNREAGLSSSGKWSLPLGNGHSLDLGYDIDQKRRREERVQIGFSDSSTLDPASNTSARTLRTAFYAQDEWDIAPQWALYGGLRWEQISQRSEGGTASLDSRSAVWSPTLQGVWRLDEGKKDQVRLGLSRTYRAPRPADLLDRVVLAENNDEFSPDVRGNPALKPELSWGLEMAYERYLSQSGMLSANLFARQIEDVIRRVKRQGADGRWLSQPINLDSARAYGVELEAKFQLAELMDDAPPLDFRANVGRYWSEVSGVPGPDNRLDGQAELSLNLGVDYRLRALPLTVGGNVNWVPEYAVQSTAEERKQTGRKRVIDLYALWRFSPDARLRVSAGNLGHLDSYSASESRYNGRVSSSESWQRSWTSWTATLELKY